MKLSSIIIEEQISDKKTLQMFINDIDAITLEGVFSNIESASRYIKDNSIDLIFLDSQLIKRSVIHLFNTLSPMPKIVLTTHHPENLIHFSKLNYLSYLTKPLMFKEFIKLILQILSSLYEKVELSSTQQITKQYHRDFVFIKHNGEYIKINLLDIEYIKSDGDYTLVCTAKKKYFVSYPLKYWSENLPRNYFCQVHKSYLININSVEKVSGNQIYIKSQGIKLPLGRTFRDGFFTNFMREL